MATLPATSLSQPAHTLSPQQSMTHSDEYKPMGMSSTQNITLVRGAVLNGAELRASASGAGTACCVGLRGAAAGEVAGVLFCHTHQGLPPLALIFYRSTSTTRPSVASMCTRRVCAALRCAVLR